MAILSNLLTSSNSANRRYGDSALSSAAEARRSAVALRDENELARLGKKQRFKRRFGGMSIVGLTCCLMLTWEASILGFGPQLLNGGPAGLFGGFIFAWGGTMLQALVMAEMASMVPLSGGQYNWIAAFAPPSYSRFLSYMAGWQTTLCWHSTIAAILYIAASSVQTLAAINNPAYVPQRWQLVLIIYALLAWGLLVNTYLGRVLPLLESLILLVHVFGFFVVLIVLLYLTENKNPASVVFGDFVNGGGWSSNALSLFVGSVGSILSFIGIDAAAHIAEEVEGASTLIPWSMIAAVMINGASGLGMMIAILFVMGDPLQIIDAYESGQLPFAIIFENSLGSSGAAVGLGLVPVLVTVFGSAGAMTATSRMMWALARENAWPGASWMSKIQGKNALPLNSIFITVLVDMLLALIILGSTTAFNAFAGMAVQGYFSVFLIVGSVGIHRRMYGRTTRPEIEPGPFSLGIWGIPVTLLALAYTIIGLLFSFWPPVPNPPIDVFNWSLVAWVGTIVCSLVYWQVHAKNVYKGPITEVTVPENDVVRLSDNISHRPK